MKNQRQFLYSIHYLRGLAILIIIAGHVMGFDKWDMTNEVSKAAVNLIMGGTAIFVMISGYMFNHVFSDNFNYKKFLIKKFRNVYLPFVVMSSIFLLRRYLKGMNVNVESVLHHLISGQWVVGYWYIGFAMLLFLFAPVYKYFEKISFVNQIFLMLILFVFSVFIARPTESISQFHSLLYYTPFYLLGMFISQHRQVVLTFLMSYKYLFLTLALITAGFQAGFEEELGNYHHDFVLDSGVDYMLIQKLFLCLFFIGFFQKFENRRLLILDRIGVTSFALYFLHPFFLYLYYDFIRVHMPTGNVFIFLLLWLTIALSSYGFAILLKRIFGKRSAYFIGW